MKNFMLKLRKEESGASHMVEIILVIIIVIAVAVTVRAMVNKAASKASTEMDKFLGSVTVEAPYVI